MSCSRNRLGGDEWRAALASNFNGLIPDHPPAADAPKAGGRLVLAQLGDVTAFHAAGNSQVLRRSAAWARRLPSDLLKVCIQRAGSATIEQGGREVTLTPGSMAIYDIDRRTASGWTVSGAARSSRSRATHSWRPGTSWTR